MLSVFSVFCLCGLARVAVLGRFLTVALVAAAVAAVVVAAAAAALGSMLRLLLLLRLLCLRSGFVNKGRNWIAMN